jgi:hypothetical protein
LREKNNSAQRRTSENFRNVEKAKGALMKSTITRILAIAMLTTSISAFAASGKAKAAKDADCKNAQYEDTVVVSMAVQPDSDQDETQSDQRDQRSDDQQLIQKQDREWLHDLQGIYGG